MLACNETVTVVRYDDDAEAYVATEFVGVSWFNKTRIRTEDKGLVYDNAVQIRIPADVLGDKELPSVGDHVFLGAPDGEVTTPAQLAVYHPRKIMAVGDNRRGGLPHVVVVGQ